MMISERFPQIFPGGGKFIFESVDACQPPNLKFPADIARTVAVQIMMPCLAPGIRPNFCKSITPTSNAMFENFACVDDTQFCAWETKSYMERGIISFVMCMLVHVVDVIHMCHLILRMDHIFAFEAQKCAWIVYLRLQRKNAHGSYICV
jgi:hypothetical protein